MCAPAIYVFQLEALKECFEDVMEASDVLLSDV
jgi:hypothetical protein